MAVRPWAKRVQSEAELLPDTLATIREAADNIHRVSQDLTEVVASLKRVTAALDAAGLAEATEMLRTSSEAMRATTRNMDEAKESFQAMGDAFTSGLAKLPGGQFLDLFRPPR